MAFLRGLLAVGLVAHVVAVSQETPTRKPLNENDALFLLPHLGSVPLGDGLQAFPSGTSALVPLGELCRLLALGIVVDAGRGQARGFFISPGRKFELDLTARRVQVEGRTLSFSEGQVRPFQNDLYVETTLLEA